MNGHPVDKIELLVLGGTWASYPVEYQATFTRDLFYAANTFFSREKRERHSLDEEKLENETSAVKIIGITLETRPDCTTPEELRRFRRYGCTRVQLGIQHTDDAILKKINRGCTLADAVQALKLLRDCCYKTDIHLMPNLPGSDPEKDRAMFDYVLHTPNLQADQWKIYPCEITPWTVIKKWYDEGSYVPYADEKLIELLMDVKAEVHPWIRLNRVIRDIPSQYILGGMDEPNLRQVICNRMIARGTPCKCIRCREVKTDDVAIASAECVVREYGANEGDEYFISFETPDRSKICGFARLRLSKTAGGGIFPELEGAALIRELHVYGQLVAAMSKAKKDAAIAAGDDAEGTHAQHTGFGTQLMLKAEEIARAHGYKKVAVIAGAGARNFYRRLGFEVEGEGELMIKHLDELPTFELFSIMNSLVSDDLARDLSATVVPTVGAGKVLGREGGARLVPEIGSTIRQNSSHFARCRREAAFYIVKMLTLLHNFCRIQDLRAATLRQVIRSDADQANDTSAQADEDNTVMEPSESVVVPTASEQEETKEESMVELLEEPLESMVVPTTPEQEETKEESMVALLEEPWAQTLPSDEEMESGLASDDETEREWAGDSDQDGGSAASGVDEVKPPAVCLTKDDERPAKRRRTASRRYYCMEANCTKTVISKGKCDEHGGGERCSREDCSNKSRLNGLCFRHGREEQCSEPGCNNLVQSKGKCSRHGGKKRCSEPDCQSVVRSRGKCKKHGGGRRCAMTGCPTLAQSGGKCKKHGGGTRCAITGCTKSAQSGGKCVKHGGGTRCDIGGCHKLVRSRGVCRAHGKH